MMTTSFSPDAFSVVITVDVSRDVYPYCRAHAAWDGDSAIHRVDL